MNGVPGRDCGPCNLQMGKWLGEWGAKGENMDMHPHSANSIVGHAEEAPESPCG